MPFAAESLPGPPQPIDPVLPALAALVAKTGLAVLQAPPGAGKTTRVPLALDRVLPQGRILMLEPRRVAARAAAERLAETLGERPGGQVGYRMRGAACPGRRIEVITEGLLTRLIQSDPELVGIVCILFDEFHERALQADLGLALALEIRAALRPDLALVAMSATLDAAPVAALMGTEIVTAKGRSFPVETRYLPAPARGPIEREAAALIDRALRETEGGVLAFLPGEAEIRRVAGLIAPQPGVVLQPLYGAMPLAEQRAAIAPASDGRKLVLATAIAETALTIPDVRVVVDAGRARRPRFDPGSGMTRLVTERITRAEAAQRRGRAGRVAPGLAYRLWTQGEEGALAAYPPPEIAIADLAGLALDLALWGAEDLPFLTAPPESALAEARSLLRSLGALDRAGRITPHGRGLAGLPLHPRLAHMLVAGGAGAAELAALLQARDPLRGDSDLGRRLAALRDPSAAPDAAQPALLRIRSDAKRLRALVRPGLAFALTPPPEAKRQPEAESQPGSAPSFSRALQPSLADGDTAGLVSLAYPDRIALRRPGDAPRWLLSGGKEAIMAAEDPLASQRLLAIAETDGDPRAARIRLAAPLAESRLLQLHRDRMDERRVCHWSRRRRAVVARIRLMLGALALEDRPWPDAPPAALGAAMADGVRDLGLDALPWSAAARRFQARVVFLRSEAGATLPDLSDAGLLADLDAWLTAHLAGLRKAEDLAGLDLTGILKAQLDWGQRALLDRDAPGAISAPTGTRLPVDWSGEIPSVSVRLQELFGLTTHPTIGPTHRPLRLSLLSPANRPVQVTSDLPGFWATSYPEVRKAMRGRYPKHPWPEDPTRALPSRRPKPPRP
ncbi:MAG: ATP-dependent helicase HrpB [Pseudomonadota bacterium]